MFDGVPTKCAKSVERMRVPAYLSKSRHGIWYFRFVFPARVRELLSWLPREVRKSMQTREPREAAMRSRKMALDLQTITNYLVTQMVRSEKEPPAQLIVERSADGGAVFRFEPSDTAERSRELIKMLVDLGQLTPQQANDTMETLRYAKPSAAEFEEARVAVAAIRPAGPWLSEAIDLFRDQNQASGKWSRDKTWSGTYEPILRHFRELISKSKRTVTDEEGKERGILDIRVREVNDQHVRDYIKAMWTFPVNWGSMGEADGLDAKQALLLGLPVQSRDTAFKKQRMAKTFLIWAYKNRFLTEDLSDVFPPEVKDKKSGPSGYLPWTAKELQTIFEQDLLASNVKYRDMMFWAPMLGLYTGARANEISQLTLSDVVTKDGIPCLLITDLPSEEDGAQAELPEEEQERKLREKNRLKNHASRRVVPIHSALLHAGFLDYVEHLKFKKESRLFPDATYEEASGYGRRLSREWQKIAKGLGIWEKRKKVFHSFRSTLNGRLFKKEVPQEVRELILGHENDSTNAVSYLKDEQDVPVRLLHEHLSQVDFGLKHHSWKPLVELNLPDNMYER